MALVGTFSDDDNGREISYEEGRKFAADHGIGHYIETNASDDSFAHKFLSIFE